MCIVSVIVSSLNNLNVCLGNARLLGKFLLQEIKGNIQIAVEEPAYQTERKHVATLQHALYVHICISQTILNHSGQGASYYAVGVYAHFTQIIFCLKLSLLQILRAKTISIDNNGGVWFGKFVLGFQCSGIHCHQYVTLVTRSENLSCANMNLKTTHTRQRTLRGTYVSRIVGECTDAVTYGS